MGGTHELACTSPVTRIRIEARLRRDGSVVDQVSVECASGQSGMPYGCQAFTHAWNPAGGQVWQGVTKASFLYGGVWHEVGAYWGQKVSA